MKGLVFTEFLELVESTFDDDMVDLLIVNTQPASGGAYTSVGLYDYQELENMVVELSKQSQIPVNDLLSLFGQHLATVFTQKFTRFFIEAGNAISLFKEIDRHIHVEVRKLYPDAELPEFSFEEATDTSPFRLHYRSERNLHMLAYGLINATLKYYNEPHTVEMKHWVEDEHYCCTFMFEPTASMAA